MPRTPEQNLEYMRVYREKRKAEEKRIEEAVEAEKIKERALRELAEEEQADLEAELAEMEAEALEAEETLPEPLIEPPATPIVIVSQEERRQRRERRKSEPVRKQEFIDYCYKMGLAGKVKYAELWARLTGNLKDKQEVTHKFDLTADDLFRIDRESKERVNLMETSGVKSLPPVAALLPEKLRSDSGQDNAQDDTLATLAVPDRSLGRIPE